MEGLLILLVLGIAGLVLLLFIGGGLLFLLKLGVIGRYALRPDEPPDVGDYALDQSQAPGDE